MTDFNHITTTSAVSAYVATNEIFKGLIREVRELSKKKPDATLNTGKVKIINRVLTDLKGFLEKEPEGKFLDLLDDQELPQTSDAVLVMVQYETVLHAFTKRYHQFIRWDHNNSSHEWITPELIAKYKKMTAKQRAGRNTEEDTGYD
ncbi:hypothetical protein [Methylocystis sp. SC2]|uniref:hypothetical protein n=1 Tax=Methylocystis sp. (strain SC2) TaxID=187303 RepID=UPI00027AF4F9|nr:hypothetical protein [Methylocystis sp. SC2]CCJ08453.1 Hypothetical protein BN69_3002 [Methylocystis sp. SC2]